MTDIKQRMSWTASSRYCPQTSPCLQASLCPTGMRNADRCLDQRETWRKSTVPVRHQTSTNSFTPLARRRHCCMDPGPKPADLEQGRGSEYHGPGSSLSGWVSHRAPIGLCGLHVFTQDSASLSKGSGRHDSGLFQDLFLDVNQEFNL